MAKKQAKDEDGWTTGRPVPAFPMRYRWQLQWEALFDCQVELLRQDIKRARADDRVIVYLSCPISSRGGGYRITNVDIAKAHAGTPAKGVGSWVLAPESGTIPNGVQRGNWSHTDAR